MAFCTMNFHGASLKKACAMNVLLPDGHADKGPFPVFYLLHGLSDDHTIWQRRTSIERYAADLPLIVVMPNTDRGFYCDGVDGPAYESHIMKDVIGFVDGFFNTIPTREARVIGGLSMGGYGALKLALKFPEMFCSTVSHSGALGITKRIPESVKDEFGKERIRIFGEDADGGKDCLYALAEKLDKKTAPAIRIDCGVDDGLLEDNRDYVKHLKSLGIEHEYEEFPGAHTWAYWDVHVQEALAFHARALGLGKS